MVIIKTVPQADPTWSSSEAFIKAQTKIKGKVIDPGGGEGKKAQSGKHSPFEIE